MSNRSERKIPKRFIERYGKSFPIWSFSRINSFKNCSFEYWLSRVKKLEGKDNIYTVSGNVAHDILEDYYNGKIKKEEMVERFDSDFLSVEISDYKFSNDELRNDSMREKYKTCLMHFFEHHIPVERKLVTEKELWIDVDGNVFMGYVDAIHKDEDESIVITDYKTSTIYTKKKIPEHSKQLLLYALGLHQGGISLDKIRCRWAFLKYVNIAYLQKNGKMKTTIGERHKWVEKIKTPLKKDLMSFYELEDWEADIKIDELIRLNSIDTLDESIKSKYELSDCYTYVDVTEESINKLKKELVETVQEIQKRSKEESDWEREEIQPQEEFYCNVLCSMRNHCKYYKNHINKKNDNQQEEIDILADLDEILDL